jgi:hypothetical protein
MSFHFLNGNSYGAYTDTGPGTIIVDPLATIQAATGDSALVLASGPWQLTVNGAVNSSNYALQLTGMDALVSNLTVGPGGSIHSTNNIAITANHAVNITNKGEIIGENRGIEEIGNGDYTIKNLKGAVIEGHISYGVAMEGSGLHTLINAGTIASTKNYSIHGGGIERVTNFGRVDGTVYLGDGNDVFVNFKKVGNHFTYGTVNGEIELGAGDDVFKGGNRAETVKDGDGKDIVKLGGGNDHFYGYLGGNGDLVDVVDGGKGIDTYDVSEYVPLTSVAVNLDNVTHGSIPASSASDFYAFQPGDVIRNFENAIGSNGNDVIWGTSGANELWGGDGLDSLIGLAGNDQLHGDAGADGLTGGAGRDQLFGGADSDTFYFESLKDSGPTAKTRDTILDFEGTGVAGGDVINLTDLNTKLGGTITDFLGVDVAFTGHKGDLRAVTIGEQTIVQLDVNGDRKADFSIALDGIHALTVDDFDL